MKATIERAALLKSLGHVQSVVERRNTIPILSNVLIEASDGGGIKLMATDLDLQVVETVEAQVETAGSITVSAHTLFDIARKLPDGPQVQLDAADGKMKVNAGRARFNLQTLPRDDFPIIAEGDLPTSFELPAASLVQIIDKTKFAISTEETRYYLNGIFMHASDGADGKVLRCVATDGHRLARIDAELPAGAEELPGVIVPRKTVNELRKLVEDDDMQIAVSVSETKIRFATPEITLTSKVIDGSFPDYTRVIPEGNDKIVEVDPKMFSSAIDRVSTISDGKSRAVKITLEGKKMTLSASSAEAGSATETVEVNGETDIEIGFNARYLLDITNQIGGEGCRMVLANPAAPTIIQDNGDPSALYVLMPLRV